MPRRLEFWFDYLSHNAYLAWCGVQPLAARHDCELIAEPVLFAGLLQHYGGKGPAEIPAKNRWMLKNVLRKARLHQIPIAPPASHPFNPLLGLRATLAITDHAARRRFVAAMFRAVWVDSKDPTLAATMTAAAEQAGLSGRDLLAQTEDPDIKDQLHAQARRAIAQDIFGVPCLRLDEELFWGFDDLPFLERHLDGSDPVSAQELESWRGVLPSARRR